MATRCGRVHCGNVSVSFVLECSFLIVGYNLVAFGGSVITGTFFVDVASDEKGLLMGRPAAVLLTNSWVPTYWIMFALFNLPNSPLLETLSPQTYRSIPGVSIAMGLAISVIDAMSRTFAISGTIEGIRNSPYPHIHVLSDSLLAMFVLGGVAAMGGGLLDGVFGLRKREWSVRTPSFLVQARDGWAFRWCAACSGIYLLLTDVNLARYVASVFETLHLAPMAYLIAPKSMLVKDSTKWVAPFLPSEAKVVICAVLIGAIAWRNVLEGIVSPPVKLSTSTQPAKSASLTPSKKTK